MGWVGSFEKKKKKAAGLGGGLFEDDGWTEQSVAAVADMVVWKNHTIAVGVVWVDVGFVRLHAQGAKRTLSDRLTWSARRLGLYLYQLLAHGHSSKSWRIEDRFADRV